MIQICVPKNISYREFQLVIQPVIQTAVQIAVKDERKDTQKQEKTSNLLVFSLPLLCFMLLHKVVVS